VQNERRLGVRSPWPSASLSIIDLGQQDLWQPVEVSLRAGDSSHVTGIALIPG
jgi:hypothetical protein